jgi:hypothetical protein
MFQSIYTSGPNGFWVFLLCTVVLGGVTAYVSGKAIAETWRPSWQVIVYGLLLALVVRFMHYALFEEVLMSARNYLVDSAVLLAGGCAGYVNARRRQIGAIYPWLGKS